VALYNVLFDIAARTAKFEEAMTRVDRRFSNMQRQAGALTRNLAGVFAVGGLAAFIKNTAAAADEIVKLAERTGRTVESVSQLQFVAERTNISIETITKSQDQLNKRLGATDEEGKAAVKALHELGLSSRQLRAVGMDEQLNLVADAMGKIVNPTQRARLEMALLGKAGTDMDAVLRSGSGGLRELRDESDRLGATMDELTARHLAELDDQIERLGGQFKTAKAELVALLATPIESYLDTLIKGFRGWQVMLGLNVSQVEELTNEINALTAEQQRLQEIMRTNPDAPEFVERRLQAVREELALLGEQQQKWIEMPRLIAKYQADVERLQAKQNDAAEAEQQHLEAATKAAEERAKAYAKWRAELQEIVAFERMMNELEFKYPTPLLDDAELERHFRETGDKLEDDAKKAQKEFEKIYKKNEDVFGKSMEQMSVYAEQAARNIQSHLADFLFDPFDKGIKGMLRGFIDVIRRMIAEAASARILEALGFGSGRGGGGFFGTVLGGLFGGFGGGGAAGGGGLPGGVTPTVGGLASGGRANAGQLYRVNERGMEFFRPDVGGEVIPLGDEPQGDRSRERKQGRPQIIFAPVYNIDARGASLDAYAALQRSMKQSNAELEVKIVERIRRGVYDFG
jgi:hypothetical protein